MPFKAFVLSLLVFWAASIKAQSKVLSCVGPTAHAYHNGYCKGLNACAHNVETITLKEAKTMGKDPCVFCYGKLTAKRNVKDTTGVSVWPLLRKGPDGQGRRGLAVIASSTLNKGIF